MGIPCGRNARRSVSQADGAHANEAWYSEGGAYVLHDHIESRDAVRRDEEERLRVVGHLVDVAHLPPSDELEGRAVGVD